mmetsp:Transcript_10311/g.31031  ORF Transcript_10311/g.31031 Transcript_10311/m.31031 type:complete len:121 (+) Transcript_10311:865-1227(+)
MPRCSFGSGGGGPRLPKRPMMSTVCVCTCKMQQVCYLRLRVSSDLRWCRAELMLELRELRGASASRERDDDDERLCIKLWIIQWMFAFCDASQPSLLAVRALRATNSGQNRAAASKSRFA